MDNLLVFHFATTSKVANIAETKPYAAPPMILTIMSTTGHKIKSEGRMHMQRTSFKTVLDRLALTMQ